MARSGKRPVRLGGIAVGLAATLLVAAFDAAGLLEDFELWLVDKRFRHCNTLPPSDRVVHIDIDDDALERIGAWPWPRSHHADLVRTLAGLGAKLVVFDIEFSERTKVRYEVSSAPDETGAVPAVCIDDDRELATAIAEAGNVILPISFEIRQPGRDEASRRKRADTLLRERPQIDEASFADALGIERDLAEQSLAITRMRPAIRQQFSVTKDALAARLGMPLERVDKYFAGAKRDVARELAVEFVSELSCETAQFVVTAAPDYQEAFCSRVEKASAAGVSGGLSALDREDLKWAFDSALSEWVVLCKCPAAEVSAAEFPTAGPVTPPRFEFGIEAAGFGFVSVKEDPDRVVRRAPLVVAHGGRFLWQMGYGVGRALRHENRPLDGVPLDDAGRCIIVWPTPPERWDAREANFTHLPAARVLELTSDRRAIRNNDELLARMRKFLDERRAIVASSPADVDRAAVDAKLAELQTNLQRELGPYPPQRSEDVEYDYAGRFAGLEAHARRTGDDLARNSASRERELRSLVENRVCLIGYTATAVADMKPMAIYSKPVPGVLVHSAMINQTLADRWIRPPVAWEGVAMILAAGVVITTITAWLNPYVSLLAMLGVQTVMAAVNGFVFFGALGIWLPAAGPLLAVATAWAAVTLYRQLTEERKKRQFASALSQYVSSAVAKRIADDIFDLAPVAGEVTCFFSDLKGFTSISERLGPAGTRDLLNPYLERMSGVLHEHRALINKFMGDGIFAFFNPPILPCEDHPVAACRAALACQTALEDLKRELAAEHDGAAELAMRIGISTGHVFVGDYGSENKRDYTCIGDTVNLAARLEPANKAFSTRIMVAESTHHLVEPHFEFRYLGGLQVVGKKQAIGVYELLGAKGEVPAPEQESAAMFSSAVEAFQRSRWDEAEARMTAFLQRRPNDPGAKRYLELIAAYRREGPPPDWNGALVLTEK